MLNKIVLASGNPEKERVANLVWQPEVDITTSKSLGYELPDNIEGEDGYYENARIKADWVGERVKMPVLADDSGMEIRGLGGKPGVSTRRWANGLNDERLIDKTIEYIRGLSEGERACSFMICAVLRSTRGLINVVEQDDGILLLSPRGEIINGHPLAALLYLPEYAATLSELKGNPEFVSKDVRAHRRLKEIFLNS